MRSSEDHTKHLFLMMTYNCNLHCIYCYEHHKTGKVMSVDDAVQNIKKEFCETAKNSRYTRLEIVFMGGEPLLEWQKIKQIVEIIERRDDWPLEYYFFIPTNGTLLNDEMKKWIDYRRDYFILGVSVDGTSQMQNINRNDSSTKIDLEYFATKWPKQSPKVTISAKTLPYLADGIIHLHNLGFLNIQANLALGQKWDIGDLKIYADQLNILISYYMDNPTLRRCSLLNINLLESLNLTGEYQKVCDCGESTICIDVDGKVYPCHMFAPITISEKEIEAIGQVNFLDDSEFINSKCKECLLNNICPRCYGMSFKNYGDIRYQEPFLCKFFKIQFLANCNLKKLLIENKLETTNIEESIATLKFISKYLFISKN